MLWRRRHWRKLLNLIDRLPRDSHYAAAIADDDELAEALPLADTHRDERLTEWSPEREVLALVYDRLGLVVSALVGLGGGSPPHFEPYPRPVTAVHRRHEAAARRRHDALSARLYPGGDDAS